MRLYTCFTPSHRPLLEQHFLPSLPAEFMHDKLRPKRIVQRSSTGAFGSDGFQRTCLDKVDFILEALRRETEPFLFSDVDVRFYGPVVDDLTKLLGDADMAFQWDGDRGRECTGFMVLRPKAQVEAFWNLGAHLMVTRSLMDQDAVHLALAHPDCHPKPKVVILPDRYWTFGRNDKHWKPGMEIGKQSGDFPPADLLVHHANWTTGIDNKSLLLDEVKRYRDSMKAAEKAERVFVAAHAPNGGAPWDGPPLPPGSAQASDGERSLPYSEVTRMLEDQRRRLTGPRHHPLPLALVLQFWKGDKRRALKLARLLADIEPSKRDDVVFVFARQDNVPMDEELYAAHLYVGRKFPVMDLVAKVDPEKKYPGVCYDPFASSFSQLANAYYSGRLPYPNALFFEPDACPLRGTWIDDIKRAHEETLLLGKRVTGPLMRFGGIDSQHQVGGHINGSMCVHLSLWFDRPSLHRCPPDAAWDVVHGTQFLAEAGPSQIIRNEHGMSGVTENQFHIMAKEAAFLVSVKDGTPAHWARRCFVERP